MTWIGRNRHRNLRYRGIVDIAQIDVEVQLVDFPFRMESSPIVVLPFIPIQLPTECTRTTNPTECVWVRKLCDALNNFGSSLLLECFYESGEMLPALVALPFMPAKSCTRIINGKSFVQHICVEIRPGLAVIEAGSWDAETSFNLPIPLSKPSFWTVLWSPIAVPTKCSKKSKLLLDNVSWVLETLFPIFWAFKCHHVVVGHSCQHPIVQRSNSTVQRGSSVSLSHQLKIVRR